MPRFLTQHQIPLSKRRPHQDRYRRMLRESLHNPGLTPKQRAEIKQRLAQVGMRKVYGPQTSSADPQEEVAETPVSEPTPDLAEPSVEPLPDADALDAMTKAEIEAQAEAEGIEGVSASKQKKSEMIDTLLAGRE